MIRPTFRRPRFLLFISISAVISSVSSSPAFALQHSLKCGSNGELRGYQASGTSDAPVQQGDRVVLTDLVDSYYSNRNSDYSVEKIKSVIRSAIRNNTDPYYALSLILIENQNTLKVAPVDPKTPESELNIYENYYGIVPLDSIAMIDLFKCQMEEFPISDQRHNRVAHFLLKDFQGNASLYLEVQKIDSLSGAPGTAKFQSAAEAKSKIFRKMLANAEAQLKDSQKDPKDLNYRKYLLAKYDCSGPGQQMKANGPTISECRAMIRSQSKTENFTIRPGASVEVCQKAKVSPPGQPAFLLIADELKNLPAESLPISRACCAQVVTDSKTPREIKSDVHNVLGFQFMKEKIQTGKRVSENLSSESASKRMALVLQAFNGYGSTGTSVGESANRCLDRMSLKKNPVYGAGTAELELNALLANPLIRQWVKEALGGQPEQNIFCDVLGPGTHRFGSTDFAKIQAVAFAGRSCPSHSFSEKISKSAPAGQKVQSTH